MQRLVEIYITADCLSDDASDVLYDEEGNDADDR